MIKNSAVKTKMGYGGYAFKGNSPCCYDNKSILHNCNKTFSSIGLK